MSFDGNIAIHLDSVSKQYRLYSKPSDRLLEALPFVKEKHTIKQALSPLSFEVKKGEVVGIVGRNGAGKSTLLQLICGTLQPTSGKVIVNGRIAALLELGSGFNPEFTGRENVWMNASLLGMSKQQISERFDDIVDFSEIGEAIDQPVKTYSSGMYVRLAFAVAVSVDPEILVIDEALSVGDGAFAKKSFDRIMQLKEAGCTILFCSHSLYQIEAICDRALWIEGGLCMAEGKTHKVTSEYLDFLESKSTPNSTSSKPIENQTDSEQNSLKHQPKIVAFQVFNDQAECLNEHNLETIIIQSEQPLNLGFEILNPNINSGVSLGVVIATMTDKDICSFSTKIDQVKLPNGRFKVELQIPSFSLLKGNYKMDAYLLCEDGIHPYEHIRSIFKFSVEQDHLEVGQCRLSRHWKVLS